MHMVMRTPRVEAAALARPGEHPPFADEVALMNPYQSRLKFVVPLIAAIAIAIAVIGPASAAEKPQPVAYKCFVDLADQTRTVVFFYQLGDFPNRFDDPANIAKAGIPKSVRAKITRFHECLLRELEFAEPIANKIEATMER